MKQAEFASIWDAIENTVEAAEEMRWRSRYLIALNRYIDHAGITPLEAAQRMGISASCLSELRLGRINRFSVAMLRRMADAVDLSV